MHASLSNVAEHTENWLGSTDPARYADGETALHLLETLSCYLSMPNNEGNQGKALVLKDRTPDEPDEEDIPE